MIKDLITNEIEDWCHKQLDNVLIQCGRLGLYWLTVSDRCRLVLIINFFDESITINRCVRIDYGDPQFFEKAYGMLMDIYYDKRKHYDRIDY